MMAGDLLVLPAGRERDIRTLQVEPMRLGRRTRETEHLRRDDRLRARDIGVEDVAHRLLVERRAEDAYPVEPAVERPDAAQRAETSSPRAAALCSRRGFSAIITNGCPRPPT